MKTTLSAPELERHTSRLEALVFGQKRQSDSVPRPVHTVYGGAHIFKRDLVSKFKLHANSLIQKYAAEPSPFFEMLGEPISLDSTARTRAYQHMLAKLASDPIEDYRIDFEDGFGLRSDSEEDSFALRAAAELAAAIKANSAPRSFGLRVRPLAGETASRALRTLDLFVSALHSELSQYPSMLIVTAPKVRDALELSVLGEALSELETKLKIKPLTHKIEFIAETPQSFAFDKNGFGLSRFADACHERLFAVHFGVFDFSSALGYALHAQSLDCRAAHFARFLMSLHLTPRGIRVVDSITNLMPKETYTESAALTAEQRQANRANLSLAWRTHFAHVTSALENGFYQGWDLHPGQLPIRFFATYLFFERGLKQAIDRINAFVDNQQKSSLLAGTFDDEASVLGIINFFRNGLSCGAFAQADLDKLGLKPGISKLF